MIRTVADVCINHQGELSKAMKLIEIAKQTGFTYVKFQKRNPDRYPEREYDSPVFGKMTYREHKRRLEFSHEEYKRIDEFCRAIGIRWTASPFDFESVDFLMEFDLPFLKIASPVTVANPDLVEYMAKQRRPVVMSTGMCDIHDIDDAVATLRQQLKASEITLLHCNSEYPTPIDHVNLSFIPILKERYKESVSSIGYSSHDGGVAIPVQSVGYGAEMIEVHVTENRMQDGSDHKVSLERTGMEILTRHVDAVEQARGEPTKIVYPGEIKIRKKVSQLEGAEQHLSAEALAEYLGR